MDYTELFEQLKDASLFDLYRLSLAINQSLDDPKAIQAIKKQLSVGRRVNYFCPQKNGQIAAIITKCSAKRVHIREVESGKPYTLPYYMLNLAEVDTAIQSLSGQLTAQTLQVGDLVGFKNREGKDLIGKIVRLNSKTVTMFIASTQERWRVHYSNLYRVYEGGRADMQSSENMMIGHVVDKSTSD
ncbi:MAG: hypothetical protein GY821_06375 [Gammaproteobacteria bacterium]|nr:hypothetical protein [Gammaproteobacteria bacterium]